MPCAPRCSAEEGTVTASSRVSTSMRTFTNWLGNNPPSSLGNCAFSFTVPVVVSIWLSAVSKRPRPKRVF